MNKKEAQRLNDVALNIIDLAHCLHTGTANEISQETWQNMFARGKNHEAARKQWRGWKEALERHGLCERVKEGREDHVILLPNAVEVAEALRAKAQAVLNHGKVERRDPDQLAVAGQTFHFKVYGRAVRPLTDREYAALRSSIKEEGRIEVAIVVDPRGNVVDGKHRLLIADELGLEDFPVNVIDGDEEMLHRLAEDLNACRRQFTKQQLAELRRQRRARVEVQRKAGKSLRQIAAEEGVNYVTIRNDLAASAVDPDVEVHGSDGRVQPASKPTEGEAEVRRERVAALVAQEKTVTEIADALGVSARTIQRDISALGLREPTRSSEPERPQGFGIVVQEVRLGETSWQGVDPEADPLETCLEAALSCLEQLRERLEEPELGEMAGAAHGIVESVLWRLMESAAMSS